MKKIFLLSFFVGIAFNYLHAQDNFLEKILNDNQDLFETVLGKVDSFEVQIIYTQINRDKNNFPHFTTFKYRVDPKQYFYAASTVKLPTAILALEKLNELKIKGLEKFTPLRIDSVRKPQSSVLTDSSSESKLPSIAHYIKKIFLVSDNDAYNRLYEFLGQKELNERLYKKGFLDSKITNRYTSGFSAEENKHTNPFTFYKNGKAIYQQPAQYNDKTFSLDLKNTIKGIGYLDAEEKLVNQPFDFSAKNFVSLENLTDILKTILFPEARPAKLRFNLKKDDYSFLYKYMSMLPRESRFPNYDSTEYYDSYVKYFMFGDNKKRMKGDIRIFNKVGLAYGYLTDIAYIVDFKNKVEFMLSATIHMNKDGIYNDGIYEYDTIGFPFFGNLGRVIYNYELNRPKKFLPKLEKFKMDYK
jgi:hypothetical protein